MDISLARLVISNILSGSSLVSNPLLIFTAIIKSHSPINGGTGVGKTIPPSSNILLPIYVGSTNPGIDELLTTASTTLPDL